MYTWNFGVVVHYLPSLLGWLRVSIKITLLVLFFGTLWGALLAVLRVSRSATIRKVTERIITLFISLPALVVIFRIFYALPMMLGRSIPAFETAIIALSFNLAAFASDIFTAAVKSVPKAQIEAGIMCQFSKWHILKEIIIPQMIKVTIAPLSWRYVETIKLTSLAAIISVDELLHVGQNIISLTYRPLEIYTAIAILYIAIILPLIFGLKYIEKKYSL